MFSLFGKKYDELWLECINADCREWYRAEGTMSSFCPACRWVFGLTAREADDILEEMERDFYAA